MLLFVAGDRPRPQSRWSPSGWTSCRTPGGDSPAILQRRRRAGADREAQAASCRRSARRFRSGAEHRARSACGSSRRAIPNASAVPMYLGSRVAPPGRARHRRADLLLPILGMSPLITLIMTIYFAGLGYVLPSMIVGQADQAAPEGNAEGAAGRAGHAGGQRRGGPGPQPGAGPGVRGDRPDQPGAERAAGAGEPGDPRRHRRARRPCATWPSAPGCRTSARWWAC